MPEREWKIIEKESFSLQIEKNKIVNSIISSLKLWEEFEAFEENQNFEVGFVLSASLMNQVLNATPLESPLKK